MYRIPVGFWSSLIKLLIITEDTKKSNNKQA